MNIPRKIALFSFVATFAFFASGLCSFPMTAMAAETNAHSNMPAMDHETGHEDTTQGTAVDTDCVTCETSQNTFSTCSLSCGSSVSKSGVVKKGNSVDEILPIADELGNVIILSVDTSPSDALQAPLGSLLVTEALLSVSKKE